MKKSMSAKLLEMLESVQESFQDGKFYPVTFTKDELEDILNKLLEKREKLKKRRAELRVISKEASKLLNSINFSMNRFQRFEDADVTADLEGKDINKLKSKVSYFVNALSGNDSMAKDLLDYEKDPKKGFLLLLYWLDELIGRVNTASYEDSTSEYLYDVRKKLRYMEEKGLDEITFKMQYSYSSRDYVGKYGIKGLYKPFLAVNEPNWLGSY